MMTRTVVLASVGPGPGASLARRFTAEGRRVGLLARSRKSIELLVEDLPAAGEGLAVSTDLTDAEAVREDFAAGWRPGRSTCS